MGTFKIHNREDFVTFTRTKEDCLEVFKLMRWGNEKDL